MRWVGAAAAILGLLVAGAATADTEYKVVEGDNIRAIAEKMGVPVDEVLGANPKVTNPNRIWPGMTLNIPASSPLAGGAGIPSALPDKPVPDASGPSIEPQSRVDAGVVRKGVPDGRLRIRGLTRRPVQNAWEIVIPDCGEERCAATVSVVNEGSVPVAGLKVTTSSWYYLLEINHDCERILQPGEKCDIRVRHAQGFKRKAPGFVVIQASDAFIRPPDEETIWFWDTVFWICPVADDERCDPSYPTGIRTAERAASPMETGEAPSDDAPPAEAPEGDDAPPAGDAAPADAAPAAE